MIEDIFEEARTDRINGIIRSLDYYAEMLMECCHDEAEYENVMAELREILE
jgi:hypothetical protein